MSANNAEPTGEVKNPDEPISGQNGVDYDSYASGGDTAKSDGKDINFDSQDIKKRHKTEYFVNVAGAEKRKRKEERLAERLARRRAKIVEQDVYSNNSTPTQSKDRTEAIVRKLRRDSFIKKNLKKVLVIAGITIVVTTVVVAVVATITNNASKEARDNNIAMSYSEIYMKVDDIRSRYGKNTVEYFDVMQNLIDTAEYDEIKARILLYRAEDLFSLSDKEYLEKALADSYKSEELDPTIDSAYWISVIEDKLGNKEKAKEYSEIKEHRMNENGANGIG